MKKLIITLLLGTGILCANARAESPEFREHLSREFTLKGNASGATLFIYNISGSVKLAGYSTGNKVIVEMDKTISADNEKDLETGKKEFQLGFEQKSDSIFAFIAQPFDSRPRKHHYNNDRDIEYEFNVDFTVKVPEGINLVISTVNNGIITIDNVRGDLQINNVNEEIRITNAMGKTYAHTVNGDVTVTYKSNPAVESSYSTINGDIKVSYQPDLSVDLQFKSMNGDLFTDFPSAQVLPSATKTVQEKKGNSSVYKLNSSTAVRLGKGGKIFRFETLNGNVYIKRQS
jgi:hypothetical protein